MAAGRHLFKRYPWLSERPQREQPSVFQRCVTSASSHSKRGRCNLRKLKTEISLLVRMQISPLIINYFVNLILSKILKDYDLKWL